MWTFNKIGNKRNVVISPLTSRILAINIISLLILVFGLLYSGHYERGLIKAELKAMTVEGKLFAGALAEGGVRGSFEKPILAPDLAKQMIRKLASVNNNRIILFGKTGDFIVDSHQMLGVGGMVEVEDLPPPWQSLPFKQKLSFLLKKFLKKLSIVNRLQRYPYTLYGKMDSYPNAFETLQGGVYSNAWLDDKGRLFMTASLPVQNLKNVLGAVLVMRYGHNIEDSVYKVQITVLKIFFVAMIISILLSLYLSETICRPITKLSSSAEAVQSGACNYSAIPDLSYRNDEIGMLSSAFRNMTKALAERIKFIESFTADIAHELKNPLASMKGAVETISMVKDKKKQEKLLKIIKSDVDRMDILITDILSVSRLDVEMNKLQAEKLDIQKILNQLVQMYEDYRRSSKNNNKVVLRIDKKHKQYIANVHEMRIAQVFQNILSNAISFSKPNDQIVINLFMQSDYVGVGIENYGPPIPEDKLDTIFNRFYTERPKQSGFGLNSGLGLSISKQIIEAHNGKIFAENIKDKNNQYRGVRFTILLPKFK